MHDFFQAQWTAGESARDHGHGEARQCCVAEPREAAFARSLPAASPVDSGRMGHGPEPENGSGNGRILDPRGRTPAIISAVRARQPRARASITMKSITLGIIKFYQACVSPTLPSSCRFYPTCSAYAYEAIEKWGLWKGSELALRRLLRCRPFAGHGYDPVP